MRAAQVTSSGPNAPLPTLVDRPGAFHERAGPGHVCGADRPSGSPLRESRRQVTVALALISAENGQPSSAASAASAKERVVGAGRNDARRERRVDDPVALALDLVHRDRAADVDRSAGAPARAARCRATSRSTLACAAASSSSGLVLPSASAMREASVTGSSNAPDVAAVHAPDASRHGSLPVRSQPRGRCRGTRP